MKYIVLVGLIFAAAVLVNNSQRDEKLIVSQDSVEGSFDSQEEELRGYASQSKQMGEVEVEVTPLNLSFGDEVSFIVYLNTHSVDLSYNLRDVATLTDDKGRFYEALVWEGGKGGHHLEGELRFEELKDDAGEVILILDGIDYTKAEFNWEVKEGDG